MTLIRSLKRHWYWVVAVAVVAVILYWRFGSQTRFQFNPVEVPESAARKTYGPIGYGYGDEPYRSTPRADDALRKLGTCGKACGGCKGGGGGCTS